MHISLLCDSGTWKQLWQLVEDISVHESRNYTSMSEVESTDSDSDSAVDIHGLQWVQVKNSGLPHNTKHSSRAWDNSG